MPPDELLVPPEAAGSRLDAWLAEALGGASRSHAASLIDAAGKERSRPREQHAFPLFP